MPARHKIIIKFIVRSLSSLRSPLRYVSDVALFCSHTPGRKTAVGLPTMSRSRRFRCAATPASFARWNEEKRASSLARDLSRSVSEKHNCVLPPRRSPCTDLIRRGRGNSPQPCDTARGYIQHAAPTIRGRPPFSSPYSSLCLFLLSLSFSLFSQVRRASL